MTQRHSPDIPGFYKHDGVKPECMPFVLMDDREEVVVFIHGFTGSPHDYRTYVPTYFEAGYDVVVPLVPGHGSHVSHLERLTWRELFIPFEPLVDWLRPRYRRIHLVGLSYGAVLTANLALRREVSTVSFLAPAFCLTPNSEKNMGMVRRFRLHKVKSRVTKKTASKGSTFQPHPFTYAHIPFQPAVHLHERAEEVKSKMVGAPWHVFHAHGDADTTTAWDDNHGFLKEALTDYTFYKVPNGSHVLPLSVGREDLARTHLAWLGAS